MNLRLTLLLLAILSLVLLSQLLTLDELNDSDDEAAALLPGLAVARNEVDRVLVTRLGKEEVLSIIMDAQGWHLKEKSGYPVNFTSLVEFLDAVTEARLTEQKTSKASFHPQLGLAESGEADEIGTQIDIQAGNKTFTFIKGIESSSQTGTFIRYPEETQVWLANRTFNASVDPLDWIDPIVINLDAERVVRVEMIQGDKVQLAAAREGSFTQTAEGSSDHLAEGSFTQTAEGSFTQTAEGSFTQTAEGSHGDLILLNQPPGTELKYPTIVSSLARILVNLRFEDVSLYDPNQWPEYGIARVELDSGESIEARTRHLDDKFLLHLQINSSDTEEPSADWSQEPSAGLSQEPSASLSQEPSAGLSQEPSAGLSQEPSAGLSQKHADLKNWQFEISEFVFKELNKTIRDMLKEDASD